MAKVIQSLSTKTLTSQGDSRWQLQELSWWLSGKEPSCQYRRHGFHPWSGKIPHAAEQLEPVHHNYWASALEPATTAPMCHNYWSPHSLEPMLHKRSHCNKKLKRSPHSPQLEEAHRATKIQYSQKKKKKTATYKDTHPSRVVITGVGWGQLGL